MWRRAAEGLSPRGRALQGLRVLLHRQPRQGKGLGLHVVRCSAAVLEGIQGSSRILVELVVGRRFEWVRRVERVRGIGVGRLEGIRGVERLEGIRGVERRKRIRLARPIAGAEVAEAGEG
jgi:hypothetical protein